MRVHGFEVHLSKPARVELIAEKALPGCHRSVHATIERTRRLFVLWQVIADRASNNVEKNTPTNLEIHNWGIRTSRELSQVGTIETFAAIDESWTDQLSFPGCKGGT